MESAENKPVSVVLVAGGHYQDRESWIARELVQFGAIPHCKIGIILEGLPSGMMPLQASSSLIIERIAPGCLCCIGNLVLRVTLTRVLRTRPRALYVAINNSEHLETLRAFLQQDAYLGLIRIQQEVRL